VASFSARLKRRLLLLSAAVLALSACGQAQYTYVQNTSQRTYFKVPASWHNIDRGELESTLFPVDPDSAAGQARKRSVWSVAYDAANDPTATHVVQATGDPFVFATVRNLADSERGSVSFDMLRNLFLPVTDSAREQAKTAGFILQDFELLRDEVLTPGQGVRGVRAVFNYKFPSGSVQTFDETAYMTDDASRIYFLLLRCSAHCYRSRQKELDGVAKSFTVRRRA
jgi:hypothetical protein